MKKAGFIFMALVATAMMLTSFQGGSTNEVTIGKQVWMSENLNVDKFRNGDPIPEAKTEEEWQKAGENKQPAWCYYDNDSANGARYGKLYNGYAVNDPRGLAPKGWHIPTDAEWTLLTDHLGGREVAGAKMKSASDWVESGNGTNESGFSGLPGGYRNHDGASYFGCNVLVSWWSSTEDDRFNAWHRGLVYDKGKVSRQSLNKTYGFYVRCLRD
jgi:uncharacterized protein (TIGR02145 family)